MSRWRAGWGVADQALSSLTNFAVGLFVARELGPAGFGAFSLASRPTSSRSTPHGGWPPTRSPSASATSQPGPGARPPPPRPPRPRSGRSGLGCVVAAALLDGAVRSAFLSLGLVLPGLLLQDSRRYVFFAARRGRDAFLNDLVDADPGAVPRRRHLPGACRCSGSCSHGAAPPWSPAWSERPRPASCPGWAGRPLAPHPPGPGRQVPQRECDLQRRDPAPPLRPRHDRRAGRGRCAARRRAAAGPVNSS